MWDLIVSVPDHCLSFYFSHTLNRNILFIRDKTIRVRNDSLWRCEEIFK